MTLVVSESYTTEVVHAAVLILLERNNHLRRRTICSEVRVTTRKWIVFHRFLDVRVKDGNLLFSSRANATTTSDMQQSP